jgi:hypothetical protein
VIRDPAARSPGSWNEPRDFWPDDPPEHWAEVKHYDGPQEQGIAARDLIVAIVRSLVSAECLRDDMPVEAFLQETL